MDVQLIERLITTIGFPIVMVGVLGWYIFYTTKTQDAKDEKIRIELSKINELSIQAINNNSILITKLIDRVEQLAEKGGK